MRKRKLVVTESELISSIEKIVKEQAAMLGFGNMGGLSLGVSKPTDKYQEMHEDDNLSLTVQPGSNDEDSWMGEDYDTELDEFYKPNWEEETKWPKGPLDGPMDDLVWYENQQLEEDSGAFEDNYFNSIKGIRTADVFS